MRHLWRVRNRALYVGPGPLPKPKLGAEDMLHKAEEMYAHLDRRVPHRALLNEASPRSDPGASSVSLSLGAGLLFLLRLGDSLLQRRHVVDLIVHAGPALRR